MLHFDNAPIDCIGPVRDRMTTAELDRMEHPPYGPDLAPCDFFLFGHIKGKLVGKQ
jgi:histone-lysine N-methyltransferase SETMAR